MNFETAVAVCFTATILEISTVIVVDYYLLILIG
jgi:hypothetical protein